MSCQGKATSSQVRAHTVSIIVAAYLSHLHNPNIQPQLLLTIPHSHLFLIHYKRFDYRPTDHDLNMKFSTIFGAAALLTSATATARSLSFMGSDNQHSLEETFPVPGDNPLLFCAKPDKEILQIDSVDLSPNPPAAYVYVQSLCGFRSILSHILTKPRTTLWYEKPC